MGAVEEVGAEDGDAIGTDDDALAGVTVVA